MSTENSVKDDVKLIGEVDAHQIETWKKKYKEIFEVKVDGHVCYLRKPDRAVMAFASPILTKEGAFQYFEEIFTNCKVGGSDIFDTDDDYFMSALTTVQDLVQLKQAEIVKL